jgi:hypothetical protein
MILLRQPRSIDPIPDLIGSCRIQPTDNIRRLPIGFRDSESYWNPSCLIRSDPIVGITDGSDGQIPQNCGF